MDMMLLERRGISGAIDEGTVEVMEIVSSDINVLRVVCDVKYAENIPSQQSSIVIQLFDLPDAFPLPMLTFAKTENSDDDKFGGGDCSPSLVLNN